MGIINIGSKGIDFRRWQGISFGEKGMPLCRHGFQGSIIQELRSEIIRPNSILTALRPMSTYPIVKLSMKDAQRLNLGTPDKANVRTIYQFIHPKVLKSCQLVMGMTILEPNSTWNTMPCHTHDRRMEVYLYFDLPDDSLVFHLIRGAKRNSAYRREKRSRLLFRRAGRSIRGLEPAIIPSSGGWLEKIRLLRIWIEIPMSELK